MIGRALFNYLVAQARDQYPDVDCGLFGAGMKVTLTNDGPVTFWLRVAPAVPTIELGHSDPI